MSNLFGGLLGEPGSASLMAVRSELHARKARWVRRPGDVYLGTGDILLRHGTFFNGRELPDQYSNLHGPAQECFTNAIEAAKADSSLRLFQGIYSDQDYFTSHAWLVAPDGGVVEVTYITREDQGKSLYRNGSNTLGLKIGAPERIAYAGIEIHLDLALWLASNYEGELDLLPRAAYEVEDMARKGMDGSQLHDFEILRHHYDPDRRSF